MSRQTPSSTFDSDPKFNDDDHLPGDPVSTAEWQQLETPRLGHTDAASSRPNEEPDPPGARPMVGRPAATETSRFNLEPDSYS